MLPIKLRIQADIQQRTPGLFNKKSLSIFLHRHTTSTGYIKALVNSPHRFDLDGQPAGDIAQEHRDAGVVELDRRLAIVQARRQAERDAQREKHRQALPVVMAVAVPVLDAADAAGSEAVDGATAAAPGQADRPPRPPRPPRSPRSPQQDRPPRADRPPRVDRPPRADGSPHPDRPPRDPHAPRPPRTDPRPPRPAQAGLQAGLQADRQVARHVERPLENAAASAVATPPSAPLTPEQIADNESRRNRAALLRTFESSTLKRANFCALKGMTDAALEAQLVQAREERKVFPQLHPQPQPQSQRPQGDRPQQDRPQGDRPRFDERGPRRGPSGGRPPR